MQTLGQSASNPLSQEEIRLARESGIALLHDLGKAKPNFQNATLRVSIEQAGEQHAEITLPNAILPLISTMLRELGNGRNIVAIATDSEVTTQQAADFLNVSRPYVVKLLEQGKIPFRKVGSRRRVTLRDLLHYKEQEEEERHQGLDELVAEAQKLGMY